MKNIEKKESEDKQKTGDVIMSKNKDFDALEAASNVLFVLNRIEEEKNLEHSVDSKFEKARVEVINAMSELELERMKQR